MPSREQPGHRERRPDPPYLHAIQAYDAALEAALHDPSEQQLRLLAASQLRLYRALVQPGKVELGHLVATPGAVEALDDAWQSAARFLLPHKHGDWGELDAFDRRQNNRALLLGGRVLSAYRTQLGEKLWVI